ncbi:MAG: ribosome biogenesis GTPase YlqF, partial [Bacilli bacterium]
TQFLKALEIELRPDYIHNDEKEYLRQEIKKLLKISIINFSESLNINEDFLEKINSVNEQNLTENVFIERIYEIKRFFNFNLKKFNENNGEEKLNKVVINWYPGHMAKTKREIAEKFNLIDIVYEVIDARMPISSKINDIDDLIKNKPRILIFTKYDLCDKKETDKFIKNYEKLNYKTICVDLLKGSNINEINKITAKILEGFDEKRVSKGLRPRAYRAVVVGVPNGGKSTLINKLVGRNAATVGNKPGVTKQLNWIRLKNGIELLDSPGILWPKIDDELQGMNLASLSSIKEEVLDKESICKYILETMFKYYPNNLKERYNIDNSFSYIDCLDEIAKKRGALLKGGYSDYDKVYEIVINDLKNGLIGNVTFDRFDKLSNIN